MKRRLVEATSVFLERVKRVERPTDSFSTRASRSVEENDAVFMLSLSEKLLLTDWLVKQRVKVFWIEHDRVGRWLTRNPWLPRLRRLSKIATTVVVSDLSREIYLKLGWPKECIVSIPNGIDLSRFTPSSKFQVPGSKTLRVGCVARLTHDKGIDLLIEAVATLPDIHLTILGTGPQEEQLKAQVSKLKAEQRVTFQRATRNIASFYQSKDVIVLPSRDHDPFGLVAAEAMVCGIPVIVTDACGIARHLGEGEALIVPAGSWQTLREAIQKLRDSHLRSSIATVGRAAAEERFSAARMTDRYADLLEEC